MEGLEIAEIKASQVLREIFRLEAKFYTSKTFSSAAYFLGEQIIEVGLYNSIYGLNGDGIGYPIIRMNEFDNLFTGKPAMHSENFSSDDFKLHSLKKGDVLICRTNGNPKLIGKSALVAKNYPYVYESHLFKIRPKNELINSATLVVFLNTKYGRMEIEKFSMQGNQANFSLAKFKEIHIPKFNELFCSNIEKQVFSSFSLLESSQELYAQAETLLLNTLGMADFAPSQEKVNIKSFKDSFLATGRLDAEYYQPKYEDMMSHIAAQNHSTLAALVNIQKSIEPGSDAYSEDEDGLPFLRVADYNKFGITEPQKRLSNTFIVENHKKLNDLKPKAGTILFSKDGSVGEAYCLSENADFITSGAILHLTVKNKTIVLPDYLTLALNSKLIRMQAERDAGGSIILHWRISEIENVIVPVVDMAIQAQIADLVQQSFALKSQSEQLLETAKCAVEIAIETDEQTALEYINAQTGENHVHSY